MSYRAKYSKSIEQPEMLWADKAAELDWFKQSQATNPLPLPPSFLPTIWGNFDRLIVMATP